MRRLLERLGILRRPITAQDIHDLWVAQGGTITPYMRETVAAYRRNQEALERHKRSQSGSK